MDVQPHEIRARFEVLHRTPVRVLALVLLTASLAVGSVALQTDVSPPGLYRPTLTQEEALDRWCRGGTLVSRPPAACCRVGKGQWLYQSDFVRFRATATLLRPLPPHPGVWAVLVALLALVVWRAAPALTVTVRPHGVWVGRRFLQADELRDCRVHTVFDRPYMEIRTASGTHRTAPLSKPHWEVEALCAEIRALAPASDEVDQIERTEANLAPRMQALLENRQRT